MGVDEDDAREAVSSWFDTRGRFTSSGKCEFDWLRDETDSVSTVKGSAERRDGRRGRTSSRGRSDDLEGGVEGIGIAGIGGIGMDVAVGENSATEEGVMEPALRGFVELLRDAYSADR